MKSQRTGYDEDTTEKKRQNQEKKNLGENETYTHGACPPPWWRHGAIMGVSIGRRRDVSSCAEEAASQFKPMADRLAKVKGDTLWAEE